MISFNARLIRYVEAAAVTGATTMLGVAWMFDLIR